MLNRETNTKKNPAEAIAPVGFFNKKSSIKKWIFA